jgi:subtilisin family serine protease
MRRSTLLVAVLAALACFLPLSAQAAGGPGADRYIVVLKDAVDSHAVANLHAARYGLQIGYVYSYALHGYSAVIPTNRLDDIRADQNVAFISADRDVQAVQDVPTGIDRVEADLSSTKSGDGSGDVTNVAVAVIDTGIDSTHPELNVVGGTNCSTGKPGRFEDGNGHGTHVSGTIAARDNSIGVVGVVPGAPLYAVRVLNNAGSGSWASVTCGIDWVTGQAAVDPKLKVASMSLGGSGSDGLCSSDALHQAICNSVAKGVTYVVAAGNSNTDFSGFVPAAYDQVLTVTAIADFNGQPGGGAPATCRADVDETPADFSNFTIAGSSDEGHTIAAPGVCILSTWKGGGYNTISGTSMATPHVSGAAALCIAGPKCAGKTPAQVMAQLRGDAAAQPSSYGFVGDPNNPITGGNGKTLYYGYLLYAGGY